MALVDEGLLTRSATNLASWEDEMPPTWRESLEWLDRAEQAREVAGQLSDPGARKAVLELAESFDRLARAAGGPTAPQRRELPAQDQTGDSWLSRSFVSRTATISSGGQNEWVSQEGV